MAMTAGTSVSRTRYASITMPKASANPICSIIGSELNTNPANTEVMIAAAATKRDQDVAATRPRRWEDQNLPAMGGTVLGASPRAQRSDAFSSTGRILEAARRVFGTGDGSGSLDQIAREAGVGIATLYRHFANRETLAEAVYERIFAEEIEPLFAEVMASDAARPAMLDFAEKIAGMIDRERGLVAALGNPLVTTRGLLRRGTELLTPVLERAQEAGTIRRDIDAADIPNILAMSVASFGVLDVDAATRRRYLNFILDAMSPAHATQPD